MRSAPTALIVAALALAAAGSSSLAQQGIDDPAEKFDWTHPIRFDASVNGVYAQAVRDFGRYVDHGWGVDLAGMFRLDRRGILALRADLTALEYGSETKRVPLSPTVGRILVDVTTSNTIFAASIGPELRVPVGPVRPFVNAAIAVTDFSTSSSVEGSNEENSSFASTENYDDATRAYRYGGGVYVPFARGRWTGGVTLGASYYAGGKASYLREGSIKDGSNGSISFEPIRSRTEFWVYNLGFRLSLPRTVPE